MSRGAQLLGSAVALTISDPWELTRTAIEPTPLGSIEGLNFERVLVALDCPIEYRSASFRYLVLAASGRHNLVDELLGGRAVECTFIGQPTERAEGSASLDTSWWRGGLAGRATVRATE